MGKVLKTAGVAPAFSVTESTGGPAIGVEVHTFRNGGVDIVGLLANRQLYVEAPGHGEHDLKSALRQGENSTSELAAE